MHIPFWLITSPYRIDLMDYFGLLLYYTMNFLQRYFPSLLPGHFHLISLLLQHVINCTPLFFPHLGSLPGLVFLSDVIALFITCLLMAHAYLCLVSVLCSEVHEQALMACDSMHRERRILLKQEIGRMVLFFTDQPSLLAPNIQV
jgi:hypothetical protein